MIIILDYFYWQYVEMPKRILHAWKNMLWFGFNYFSISYCIKTIFSPWKKTTWIYPKGLDIGKYFEIFTSNLISRILGFLMKLFTIMFCFFYEIIVFVIGLLLFLIWLIIPFIAVLGIVFAIQYV